MQVVIGNTGLRKREGERIKLKSYKKNIIKETVKSVSE